jgi:N-methylhydantoinase A/oxoprolinase/acetone carboxylase beta subunit
MGLRIGIDVGGTFTHGVVLQPPGAVLATARTPTTHTDPRGVAAGVEEVLRLLLAELQRLGRDRAEVELVAHSTTQATNALLEGDLAGVHLLALVPPGERGLVARALRSRRLSIGGGHSILLWPKLMHAWETATPENFPPTIGRGEDSARPGAGQVPATTDKPGWEGYGIPAGFTVADDMPVAVVQPLAGKYELREQTVAAHYRAFGHPVVCAGDITQVLGLQARARTAVVNAAMLPTMLATADYTEAAVARLLPGVPLQVVRSDGGAMTIAEMRRQPILSLLSGPAAGASAALHRTGLSDAIFIEVGGTSTDITLIKDGRVRHRSATVGGQRLMVPALDLRTVAVGGGSMLRAVGERFGPRSAHIAGLPYLFQALGQGLSVRRILWWADDHGVVNPDSHTQHHASVGRLAIFSTDLSPYKELYFVAEMSDGTIAAITATDMSIAQGPRDYVDPSLGFAVTGPMWDELDRVSTLLRNSDEVAMEASARIVVDAILELAREHRIDLTNAVVIGGGGGAPVVLFAVAQQMRAALRLPAASRVSMEHRLIDDYPVISAIGAALAVTCVSLSRNCAQPTGADIAALVAEVEARLAAQGAERVATDYEYDPRRQVLTVTGRGSRPYEQDARTHNEDELRALATNVLKAGAERLWGDDRTSLWQAGDAENRRKPTARLACALNLYGRVLWLGRLTHFQPAPAGQIEAALNEVVQRHTQHTDGGAILPGLGLLADARYIPLDALGSAELIAEVLRWEGLPATSGGCFVVRA